MNFGVFLLGLILLGVGIIYLAPRFGMNLIPITLPNFGIEPLYIGGGLAGIGFILLIAGAKMY